MSSIVLNYGIEIECVFELLDELTVLHCFIEFYSKDIDENMKNKFDEMINNLLIIISLIKTETLQDNEIYKDLISLRKTKRPYEFFNEKYKFIVDNAIAIHKEVEDIQPEINNFLRFINDLYNFINKIIEILLNSEEIPKDHESYKKILEIFEIEIDNIKEVFKTRFNLNDNNIEIYYEENMASVDAIDEMTIEQLDEQSMLIKTNGKTIKDFMEKSKNPGEKINLLLTEDRSVECDNSILYKNIISGSSGILRKYKYLLNKCEFITQVFKTTDEVRDKLKLFFTNEVINKTILNCLSTSNHVHISFNQSNSIIKPDIRTIFIIVVICHMFQDKIFDLFLNTRKDNKYCKKMTYNGIYEFFYEENQIARCIIVDDMQYNKNLDKILTVFFGGSEEEINSSTIHNFRYYWLNLVNLFGIEKIQNERPPTIEFRIKHGSADAEELKMVCMLYENIIKEAIRLTDLTISKRDIISDPNKIDIIIFKRFIESQFKGDDYFNNTILENIKDYFTGTLVSPYKIGLDELNGIFLQQKGGVVTTQTKKGVVKNYLNNVIKKERVLLKKEEDVIGKKKVVKIMPDNFYKRKINELKDKNIYKINSFGYQFIGRGLDDKIIDLLKPKFNLKTDKEFELYMKKNNFYYNFTNK
jgi:hypothetical protein